MIGIRTAAMVFSVLVAIGHCIFALGVTFNSYSVALIGRGIFGCGGENLSLAQTIFIVHWFTGKELSLAMGLSTTIARLGSVICNNIEPIIVELYNIEFALWLCFIACIISIFAVYFMNQLDYKRDFLLGINNNTIGESEKFSFKKIFDLNLVYWVLVVNCIAVYNSIFCFTFISSNYFQQRFGYDSVEAGFIISITFLSSVIFSPIAGIVSDKTKKNGLMLVFSSLFGILAHVLMVVTPNSEKPTGPIIYLVLLGIGYSIFATVY